MTTADIKKLRADLGLTQVGFAKHLGVSTRTVQGWEGGKRPAKPTMKLMVTMKEQHKAVA